MLMMHSLLVAPVVFTRSCFNCNCGSITYIPACSPSNIASGQLYSSFTNSSMMVLIALFLALNCDFNYAF